MNTLNKLLQGVEVEWKTLGDETFIKIANSGRKPHACVRTSQP